MRPRVSVLLVDFDWSFRSRLSKRLDKSKLIFCLFSVIKEDRSSCLRLEAKEDAEESEVDDLVPSPQDNSRFSVLSLENLPKDVCSLDVEEVSLRPLLLEVGIILKCSKIELFFKKTRQIEGSFALHTIRKVKFLSKNLILTKPRHFTSFSS